MTSVIRTCSPTTRQRSVSKYTPERLTSLVRPVPPSSSTGIAMGRRGACRRSRSCAVPSGVSLLTLECLRPVLADVAKDTYASMGIPLPSLRPGVDPSDRARDEYTLAVPIRSRGGQAALYGHRFGSRQGGLAGGEMVEPLRFNRSRPLLLGKAVRGDGNGHLHLRVGGGWGRLGRPAPGPRSAEPAPPGRTPGLFRRKRPKDSHPGLCPSPHPVRRGWRSGSERLGGVR